MGRAKVTLELIAKEKARILTFNQRKKGLLKKIDELSTLCDVAACLIIYGPKQDSGSSSEPEIWPEDPNQVRRVLDLFRAKKKDNSEPPNYGVSKYLEDRKKKIECDLAKQRKKNLEAKYPTRPEFIDFMTESQLRGFAASLQTKADFVRSRIDFLRGSNMAGYAHQPQWPSHHDYPLLGNENYYNNHDSSFSQFGSSDLRNDDADDQLDLSFLDLNWDELSRYCEGWNETKPAEQYYYSCGAPMGLQQVQFLDMEGIGG